MRILGIETSCDDTGIAVLEINGQKNPHFALLANVVASQIKVHQKYGGVYPMLAKREHQKNLPIVLKKALKQARLCVAIARFGEAQACLLRQMADSARQVNIKTLLQQEIDAIAVTQGPGLSPCLWTGVNFAKELAREWDVPLIPVNHITGHLLISLLMSESEQITGSPNSSKASLGWYTHMHNLFTGKVFPAIALIVSGGHTQLVLVKDIGKYQIIGETRDDAAGECFDKTARILGLPYPGGPAIAAEAAKLNPKPYTLYPKLPRPMMHTKDYDFSFSGLKTAVLYNYQAQPKRKRESKAYMRAMAAEIQQAIIDVLVHKTLRAVQEYNAKTIILGGGVAANDELRKQFNHKLKTINYKLNFLVAAKELCTDNGAMIAVVGYFHWLRKNYTKDFTKLEANPNLRIA